MWALDTCGCGYRYEDLSIRDSIWLQVFNNDWERVEDIIGVVTNIHHPRTAILGLKIVMIIDDDDIIHTAIFSDNTVTLNANDDSYIRISLLYCIVMIRKVYG